MPPTIQVQFMSTKQEKFEAQMTAALEPFVQDGVLVEQIVARASIFATSTEAA